MAPDSFVTVYVGISLDGFIARENGGVDWLEAVTPGSEPPGALGFAAFMERVDALVMGRNTYDTVLGFGGWHYGDTPVYVLTHRRLDAPEGADVRPIAGTPAEILAATAAAGCHRIYVDGGAVVQEFLRAGLVDELVLSRLPVLIGSGIPLFGPLHEDLPWQHLETHANGAYVQSIYRRPVPDS